MRAQQRLGEAGMRNLKKLMRLVLAIAAVEFVLNGTGDIWPRMSVDQSG